MLHGHVARKIATMKGGLFGLDIDKEYPTEMCFPDGWTWHITTFHFYNMDHTPFQSLINLRTKPCTFHQFYRALNNILYSAQQHRVCIVVEYYHVTSSAFKNIIYYFSSLIFNLSYAILATICLSSHHPKL